MSKRERLIVEVRLAGQEARQAELAGEHEQARYWLRRQREARRELVSLR